MLHKVYRKLVDINRQACSFWRIIHFRIMYPGAKIDFQSYLGPGATILCTDGARLRITKSYISKNTAITVDHQGEIEITNSYVGANCIIVARQQILINKNCQIAEMVVIRDQDHKFGSPGLSIEEQGFETAPIIIGENVWLGAKATILKGVTIGNNAVVGASSVVNSNIEPNSLYLGIPARRVR